MEDGVQLKILNLITFVRHIPSVLKSRMKWWSLQVGSMMRNLNKNLILKPSSLYTFKEEEKTYILFQVTVITIIVKRRPFSRAVSHSTAPFLPIRYGAHNHASARWDSEILYGIRHSISSCYKEKKERKKNRARPCENYRFRSYRQTELCSPRRIPALSIFITVRHDRVLDWIINHGTQDRYRYKNRGEDGIIE